MHDSDMLNNSLQGKGGGGDGKKVGLGSPKSYDNIPGR